MNWTEEEYQEFMDKKKQTKSKAKPKAKPKRKNKYGNKKTTIDGIEFDSKKEAEYYLKLKQQKADGEISHFGLQPEYELQPRFHKNGKTYRPIKYIADFIIKNNDGTYEIVDIKGVETKDFKIKKKMFEFKFPELELKIIK